MRSHSVLKGLDNMNIFRKTNGEGRLGLMITIIIILVGIFIGFKVIPVKFNIGVFNEFLEEQCRNFQSSPQYTEEKSRKAILSRAEELDLPLDKKHLKVKKQAGRILIEVEYTVEIPLPFYTIKMVGDKKTEHQLF